MGEGGCGRIGSDEAVSTRWEELAELDRSDVRVAWTKAFGEAPPHFLSMIFMRKALIWDAQCRRSAGIPADLKRALKAAAGGKSVRGPAPVIRTGTQHPRAWHGRTYQLYPPTDGCRL